MEREAGFLLDCSDYSENVLDVIQLLNSVGWTYYDEDGSAEYLPPGDRDSYDWQIAEPDEGVLCSIISRKCERGEMVGLVMYYRDTGHGVTLLAQNTGEVHIIPNISRVTLDGDDPDSLTDVSWYVARIVMKLMWQGCAVNGYSFEELSASENN